MSANKELTPDDASIMLDECIKSLRLYEKKEMQIFILNVYQMEFLCRFRKD